MTITPELIVENIEKSLEFYTLYLDFKIIDKVPDKAPYLWVHLKKDDVTLMMQDINTTKEEFKDYIHSDISPILLYTKIKDKKTLDTIYNKIKEEIPNQLFKEQAETAYGTIEFGCYDYDKNRIIFSCNK